MRDDDNRNAVARALVRARAEAIGIPCFPPVLPGTIEDAYGVQREAAALWPDRIAGWKVGRISADAGLPEDRFVGPIFGQTIMHANSAGTTPFPVFPQGFAAVEAELLAVLAHDITPDGKDWAAGDAAAQIAALHIGMEVAGSPVGEIAKLGPFASIAAFGNNAGLIVGPEVPGGLESAIRIPCATSIDGVEVGRSIAANIPGGPATALAFALTRLARLGITVPAGTIFATGAITGVHQIRLSQSAIADFGLLGAIAIGTVAAQPFRSA